MSDFRFNKYFKRSEFACNCGCGFDTIDKLTFDYLMASRIYFGDRLIVNSGCRCVEYNEIVQKRSDPDYIPYSSDSQHMYARAVDHFIVGITTKELYKFYEDLFDDQFGLGLYNTFVHIDTKTGKGRRW